MYKKVLCVLLIFICFCTPVRAEELSLSSASAVVLEVESGRVLYEKDAHTARPMASTTKLMTALLAAEMLPKDMEITVSREAVAVEGSALGLRAGDGISVSDLLTGLLLASGNDAANATAEAVAGDLAAFASLMNAKAAALGMKNSGFVTPSGLDAEGHAASAYDMALLGRAVLKNDYLREICGMQNARLYFGNPKREVWVRNHNRLLTMSADCIGMKTGFTKKSGRCLVSAAERDGVTIVVVTLNGGDYWNDHLKLYTYAFSRLERITPQMPTLSPIGVAGGMTQTVALETTAPKGATVLTEEMDDLQISVQLPPFLWAPIAKGETVGQVLYRYSDTYTEIVPITVCEDAVARPQQSAVKRFLKNCYQMFRMFVS